MNQYLLLGALFVVSDLNGGDQLTAIAVTFIVAALSGLCSGKIISFFGRRVKPYVDAEEFEGETEEVEMLPAPLKVAEESEA